MRWLTTLRRLRTPCRCIYGPHQVTSFACSEDLSSPPNMRPPPSPILNTPNINNNNHINGVLNIRGWGELILGEGMIELGGGGS